jgi:hypothetical protein
MLYACRESRAVASSAYTRVFGTDHAPARTWFDFDHDTLYLNMTASWDRGYAEAEYSPEHLPYDVEECQNLALYLPLWRRRVKNTDS